MNASTYNMTWEDLKSNVYHEDGSLRDIYIRNISFVEWKTWVDHVNSNYVVEFEVGETIKRNKIDFNLVAAYWENSSEDCPSASVHLGNIIVKIYFSDENEIENDITPTEIKTIQDHKRLVEYLMNISKVLSRPVELTEENPKDPAEVLMLVNKGEVIFPNQKNGG